jgi:hypothetical protein
MLGGVRLTINTFYCFPPDDELGNAFEHENKCNVKGKVDESPELLSDGAKVVLFQTVEV